MLTPSTPKANKQAKVGLTCGYCHPILHKLINFSSLDHYTLDIKVGWFNPIPGGVENIKFPIIS